MNYIGLALLAMPALFTGGCTLFFLFSGGPSGIALAFMALIVFALFFLAIIDLWGR